MTMEKLINGKGQIVPGVLDEPVKEINYLDYDLRTVMDRPRSRLARRWRFNQFQFVSAMGPGWVFGLAVVDLKLLGSGFFYLYDFETGQMMEQSFLQPLARQTRIEPLPEEGVATFSKGEVDVRIAPTADGRTIAVSAPGDIRIELTLKEDRDPLRLVCPAGYNGWVFTRKSAGLPVEGEVRWDHRIWRCDEETRGTIDWSCGFMRRETAWNWACLAGQLPDGRIDLHFVPAGVRKEKLNAWVLASNFRQYVGTFNGTVTDEAGGKIEVKGLRGLMEDHFARW